MEIWVVSGWVLETGQRNAFLLAGILAIFRL